MNINFGILNKRQKEYIEKLYYKCRKHRTIKQALNYLLTNYTGCNSHKAIKYMMFEGNSEDITLNLMLEHFFKNCILIGIK